MEAYLELQRWWLDTSANVVTAPTPQSQVENLEARYAITLPDDFKKYILNSCPIGETWDIENSSWWSFDRIKNIPEEYQHEIHNAEIAKEQNKYLFFADHCIWCWAWAISCANDENRGKVAIIGGNPERFVADSFSEFIKAYLKDFRSVS